ncbi:MAG: AAA family ATPase, partial [Omnitrophica WOR_2 bacterium]
SRQVMRIPMQVQLLGGFGITYADKLVNGLNASRLQSLIAYLILTTNIPQARQHIAFILWPDTSEAKGRNNLRQLLYQLRHLLPDYDRFIDIEDDTVTWRLDDNQSIDIQRFVRALDEAESAEQRSNVNEERRWLAEALSIYRGDLLPGCYDEWILSHRERLKHRRMQANQKLVQILEQQRDYPSALQAAESLLNLDPLDESTYLTLMRLHELNHDQAASRRVYYSAVKTLQLELGVEPGEMLRQEYERLQIPSAKRYPRKSSLPVHLVGRQNEWQQLQVAWGQALDGGTYFVLITGEAGIGKSRLAEELFQWAAQQGITCAHARCYAAEGRLSLAPVTEWLRSPDLRQHLGTLDRMWLTELARVLPELMSDRPDLARPEPISEYGRRQRFFEAIARGVLLAPLPILLWIDDLQWCDPETLEWLHFLLRFEPHKPLLVLGTARSEESPPDHPLIDLSRQLRAEDKFARIELSPLDAAETGQLASMTSGVEFDVRATTRLFHETEGNPLFVVEMVRAGFSGITQDEAARLAGADQELPPRVHAIIARRLAHLSILARKIAELGALTGREFSLDLILRAGQDDEANVILALDELWQKRIFHEQGANVFDFTHDKLREVMISEIPVPQRRLLHRHIAQALEAMYTGNLDPVSGQIAAQYEQAGMPDQAVPYYQRAAAVAAGVYANEDAITMLRRGISLLDQLPAGDRHDRLELMIQMALAPLYRITRGWTSPEVEACTNRAMVLCEKVGNISQRTQILFGLQSLYVVQSRLEKVETTYALAHKLYLQTNHTTPPPFTAIMYAGTKLHMGELQTSSDMFEKIVALHDDAYILDLQESQGVNYIVHGYAWNAHALWLLGYPQMAINSGQAAVQVARQDAQPFNQALAITYLSLLQEWNAAPGRFAGQAEEALQLSGEYKAPYYYAWSNILACFARAQQQPDAEHLTSLRKAIRDFTNSGAHLRMPYYLSLLARAWSSAGKPEKGLAVIEEGLAEALQHNEHWWDAELHRLRGELRLSQGAAADEVEGAFSRAIEIARSQEARSLELRAATSLARLWYANGEAAEARQLLQPLIAWFTEGFDTPDLQAAQTLIQQSSE